jgi:hypothetical protein
MVTGRHFGPVRSTMLFGAGQSAANGGVPIAVEIAAPLPVNQ